MAEWASQLSPSHVNSRFRFEPEEQIALHRGDEVARGARRMQILEVEIRWTTRDEVFCRSLGGEAGRL